MHKRKYWLNRANINIIILDKKEFLLYYSGTLCHFWHGSRSLMRLIALLLTFVVLPALAADDTTPTEPVETVNEEIFVDVDPLLKLFQRKKFRKIGNTNLWCAAGKGTSTTTERSIVTTTGGSTTSARAKVTVLASIQCAMLTPDRRVIEGTRASTTWDWDQVSGLTCTYQQAETPLGVRPKLECGF